MNKVILIGRLTADPEEKATITDTQMARYTLAVDRLKKNGEQNADFLRCVAFGRTAEFALKYLKKGKKIAVVGRIQTGRYTNNDGATVYTTDIIVENQEFVESKSSEQANNEPVNLADAEPEEAWKEVSDTMELPFV